MHLADRLTLPPGYSARPYAGRSDHAAMADVLNEYRLASGEMEMVDAAHFDLTYSRITDCDPDLDIAIVEHDGSVVGYSRPTFQHLADGTSDLEVFVPTHPDHLAQPLFDALVDGAEAQLRKWVADGGTARYLTWALHPGPGEEPLGEARWYESRGYVATEWSASMRRPHLNDIPDLPLPDGIEVRPVTPDQIREIVVAHIECFRGEWGFHEPVESDYAEAIDDPLRDESLWQIAWDGDTVVGQVKPFINDAENEARGYLRGYTEYISTHHGYRNRGIAGALLARALKAVADRGMTEAALGVDTNNPGGAFQLYSKLGFELEHYLAIYTKPVPH